MEVVKHNKSFIIKDTKTGKTYEMKISDFGWSFSTVRLYEIIKYSRPRYYFFGDVIEDTKKVVITRNHRGDNLNPIIDKSPHYNKEKVKGILEDLLKSLDLGSQTKIVNRIEI